MSNKEPTEARIQQQCFIHYQNTYCLPQHKPRCIIWHVANENAQRLMSIGLLAGVSDLVIIHAIEGMTQGVHVYIEVKTPKGKQSPAQVDFMRRIEALGYEYHVVRSVESFVELISLLNKRLLQNFATQLDL